MADVKVASPGTSKVTKAGSGERQLARTLNVIDRSIADLVRRSKRTEGHELTEIAEALIRLQEVRLTWGALVWTVEAVRQAGDVK